MWFEVVWLWPVYGTISVIGYFVAVFFSMKHMVDIHDSPFGENFEDATLVILGSLLAPAAFLSAVAIVEGVIYAAVTSTGPFLLVLVGIGLFVILMGALYTLVKIQGKV